MFITNNSIFKEAKPFNMKKKIYLFLIIPILLQAFLTGCKEQGMDFLSVRNINGYIMVNLHDAQLHLKAYEDSVLFRGIHYAEVQGEIFDIIDTASIVAYGHCWSLEDEVPDLYNAHSFKFLAGESGVNASDSAFLFKTELYDLELDTYYYLRSFVIIKYNSGQIDTGYNQKVKRFRTRLPEDIWFHNNDFDNLGITEATSFTLDNKAYIACGFNGSTLLNDVWEYDMESDSWTNVAQLGGGSADRRMSAVSFVLNDTVYLGTGIVDLLTSEYAADMWKWNIKYNVWSRIDSLGPSRERANAIAFSLQVDDYVHGEEPRGYIGLGQTNFPREDLMYYDFRTDVAGSPTGASWVNITPFLGGYRTEACVSVIDNLAFVGSGKDNNGNYKKDFYIFDPESGSYGNWRGIPFIPDSLECESRANAVSFSLSYVRPNTGNGYNFFYFGTGRGENDTLYNDWFGYDINLGIWKRCSDIRADADIADGREGAVAFDLTKEDVDYGTHERGFVATGKNKNGEYKKDVWEYLP